MLRKCKLLEYDLRKPVCFNPPWFYVRVERGIRRFGLENVSKELWCECKKVLRMVDGKEELEIIGGLSEFESEEVWRNVCIKDLTNRQMDVAWMIVHGCLPTRVFQRRRRLVDSEVCPREGCRGYEDVVHLLWKCEFAMKVWSRMRGLIKVLTWVEGITYEMIVYGLCNLGETKRRVLWLLVNCVKECLWDVRNILVFKSEKVSVKECAAMIRGRLYFYGLCDIKNFGSVKAQEIWCFRHWKYWV